MNFENLKNFPESMHSFFIYEDHMQKLLENYKFIIKLN